MKYTVAEFRASIRKILNDVDQGIEVVICRYDKEYVLSVHNVQSVQKPKPSTDKANSKMDKVKIPLHPAQTKVAIPIAAERLENGLCKIHGIPLTAMGKCLQKGCKYA